MKLLSMILLSLCLGKGCSSQTNKDLKDTAVEYTASTRGFYMKISIKDQMLSVSKDRNASNPATKTKITDADWEELIESFKIIDLKSISTLKSPTEKRYYDGAAIGNLKVNYKDKEYESSAFDHGFPPEQIKKFVDKINSFVKKE
jgi:hypothetical protein